MGQVIDLIVYHGDCPDGWCAAYLAHKRWPSAQLFGATHGGELPNVKGKDVLVVDFSWKREVTLQLLAEAKSMVILDHHATAEKELAGIGCAQFDMTRSGAAMMWDYLYGGVPDMTPELPFGERGRAIPRPWYVNYVQDRDLWTWKLPNSRAISAAIMATPMTTEEWDKLTMMDVITAGRMGDGIVKHINHYVKKVADQAQFGTYLHSSVSVVNAAYPNISDVCNELCERGADIGLGWFQRGDGLVQFSLRSIGDLDVSLIAKSKGGGGHKNAAGFQLPLNDALAFIGSIL
jgi:uncharacterized protein